MRLDLMLNGLALDAMDSGGGGGGESGAGGGQPAAHVELTDDSLFKAPGIEKPVRFGDWSKGYVSKADFTKKTQEYAGREGQWRDAYNKLNEQLGTLQKERTAQPQQVAKDSFENDLKTLSEQNYVDGKTAAGLVMKLVQNGIAPLANSIQQRDEVIKLLYNQLKGIQGTVGQLSSRTQAGDTASIYASAKKDVGLPDVPVINEFLQDIYLSHTGNDLNQEFPKMVRERWTSLVQAVREWDKQEAKRARESRFGLGRGGSGTPGRPAKKGFETAEDIAKAWFPILSGGNDT